MNHRDTSHRGILSAEEQATVKALAARTDERALLELLTLAGERQIKDGGGGALVLEFVLCNGDLPALIRFSKSARYSPAPELAYARSFLKAMHEVVK